MNGLFEGLDDATAVLSADGQYRYTLTREWADGRCIAWLMFNPSTADATVDDATIRKCVGFSKRWGYGRMIVVNLFAIRNRDPKAVRRIVDPVGPMNNYWIKQAASESRELVCAWGCGQHFPEGHRISEVSRIFTDLLLETVCLGRGKDGHPRHPLMLSYSTPKESFQINPGIIHPHGGTA